MCSAAEFKEIGTRDHSSEKEADRKKLKLEVQEYMVKTLASKREYVDRAHVLILAYLLRVPIPDSLQADLALLLQDAHRLLGALFSICLARKFVKATMGCIELMQMITQALAPNSSPLLQIPFLTSKEIRLAGKKRMDSLETFRAAEDEKRMKVYSGHTETEWKRIKEVCDRLPDLAMECHTSVDGEDGIFEGDLVTIRVTLERIKPGVTRKSTQSKKIATVVDGEGETTEATDDKDDVDDSVVSDLPLTGDEDEDVKMADQREKKLLNTLPVAKAPPSKFGKDDQQVTVHSAFYPHPKVEKWVLLLFQKHKNKTLSLLAIQKVPDFREKEVVELRMKVGEKGPWPYELHAKCDSYVGCDVSLNFKITVNKLSKAEEDRRDEKFAQSKLVGLDEDEEAPEKAYEGKWYYAGFASFWELALNAAVVLVMFFFVMNFLQQRGYWQLYVDPIIAKGFKFVAPVYNALAPTLRPVLGPLSSAIETALITIGNWTTVDPEELIRVKQAEL
jgi:translocation protein SEC63